MELRRRLAAHPRSAAQARQMVHEALDDWGLSVLLADATLLVSELVTNSILHAGSEIELRLRYEGRALRVEVGDGSASLPSSWEHDAEAVTGRGLEMVSLLATRTGATPATPGKVVWFELDVPVRELVGAGRRRRGGAEGSAPAPVHRFDTVSSPVEDTVAVRLRDVPIRLFRSMQQHSDALLRETTIAHIAHLGEEDGPPPSSLTSALGLAGGEMESQLQTAVAKGATNGDVEVHVARDAADTARNVQAILDVADTAARRGALLLPAALPEVRECRQWFLSEVAEQLAGHTPVAWLPGELALGDPDGLLATVDHATILDQLGDGVVIGDDENRVVYLNPAAEQLLGWEAGELVGRRLTRIIPPRLRDAHVAGFTRYLLTGEARLLGTPVRVPALHRKGHEVPVELMLNGFRTEGGRQAFVASLRDLTDRVALERRVTIANAFHATAELVATLASSRRIRSVEDAAPVVLAALGEHLGWQFGAAWTPVGDELSCVQTWQDDGRYDRFASISRARQFARGSGLPGRVWASGEPTWVTDVVADANFPRAQAALEDGLRTAFAFPVTAGGEVDGVFEFYTHLVLDPDSDLLATAGTIGSLVALLVR